MIICLPGWTGPDCCENIDECSPNPCEHREKCTDAVSGYFCDCIPGYEVFNNYVATWMVCEYMHFFIMGSR